MHYYFIMITFNQELNQYYILMYYKVNVKQNTYTIINSIFNFRKKVFTISLPKSI